MLPSCTSLPRHLISKSARSPEEAWNLLSLNAKTRLDQEHTEVLDLLAIQNQDVETIDKILTKGRNMIVDTICLHVADLLLLVKLEQQRYRDSTMTRKLIWMPPDEGPNGEVYEGKWMPRYQPLLDESALQLMLDSIHAWINNQYVCVRGICFMIGTRLSGHILAEVQEKLLSPSAEKETAWLQWAHSEIPKTKLSQRIMLQLRQPTAGAQHPEETLVVRVILVEPGTRLASEPEILPLSGDTLMTAELPDYDETYGDMDQGSAPQFNSEATDPMP